MTTPHPDDPAEGPDPEEHSDARPAPPDPLHDPDGGPSDDQPDPRDRGDHP